MTCPDCKRLQEQLDCEAAFSAILAKNAAADRLAVTVERGRRARVRITTTGLFMVLAAAMTACVIWLADCLTT